MRMKVWDGMVWYAAQRSVEIKDHRLWLVLGGTTTILGILDILGILGILLCSTQ